MIHFSAKSRGVALILAIAMGALPAPAAAAPNDKVRISDLVDVAFGTLVVNADASMRQNVCAFSNSATSGYSVTASGSGTSGAFTLTTGSFTVPYEVQWADSTNQTAGTALSSGSIATGFVSAASQQSCNSGASASATLIVIVRATALASARAGNYSGTLTLTLAPE